MPAHLDVLRSQLEAYGAAWERQSASMECWELQVQLKLAAALFDVMYAALEKRGEAAGDDRGELRDAYLRDVHAFYALWHKPSVGLLGVLKARQREGCSFAGIGRFEADCASVGDHLQFDVERTIRGLHDIDAGRTVSIEVLRNELRNRVGQRVPA